MKPTILLFNFNDKTELQKLTAAFLPLGVRIKKIKKAEYLQPLGVFVSNTEITSVEEEYRGEELKDRMILMSDISGNKLDQVLFAIRRSDIKRIPYKAVLTQTNQHWNAIQLFEELCKEHEAIAQSRGLVHEAEQPTE